MQLRKHTIAAPHDATVSITIQVQTAAAVAAVLATHDGPDPEPELLTARTRAVWVKPLPSYGYGSSLRVIGPAPSLTKEQ